jgi:demethylmenaquinone methyltransferase/2-methoxy-6-polyprenyl-1,4-benzoquinol methylase
MAYDFDTIACDYDRMNHLMTLGLDRLWRRRAVRGLHGNVLDVACGTGDMVVELQKHGCNVTGVDLSKEMMAIARQKAPAATYMLADAERLPFPDGAFDAVTCAFGVRNFVHLEQGLKEMLRVLKPGGRMVILELATPDNPLLRPFYNLYTKHIIPWLGQHLAGSREAYTYLPISIERFPKGDAFLDIIHHSSFIIGHCRHRRLIFGVCRLYTILKG